MGDFHTHYLKCNKFKIFVKLLASFQTILKYSCFQEFSELKVFIYFINLKKKKKKKKPKKHR